jgi:hypothetical protein
MLLRDTKTKSIQHLMSKMHYLNEDLLLTGDHAMKKYVATWGGGDARGAWGRVPNPTSVFCTRFCERRAIRQGGGGTQAHINPLPPGCNHHRNAPHARSSSIKHIFPSQRFLHAFWVNDE